MGVILPLNTVDMETVAMSDLCMIITEQLSSIHNDVQTQKQLLASYTEKRKLKTLSKQDIAKEVATYLP